MFFASDLPKTLSFGNFGNEDTPADIVDFIASILCDNLEARMRKNLSYGFNRVSSIETRLRGKVNHLENERFHLLAKGRVSCRYDELSLNTPKNCFIRGALEIIAGLSDNVQILERVKSLISRFQQLGITSSPPLPQSMTRVGLNDREDAHIIAISKLIYDFKIPTTSDGNDKLYNIQDEKQWVYRLYEKAILGMYKHLLPSQEWEVSGGDKLKWQTTFFSSKRVEALLPNMKTDITIRSRTKDFHLIIDTKFNNLIVKGQFQNETIRSGYVYQMYAYLQSQVNTYSGEVLSKGMLLHPSIGESIEEEIHLQGHPIKFCTIDLTENFQNIKTRLLDILEFHNESKEQYV